MFVRGGTVPEYEAIYIAFEAVTVFTDIAAHKFSIDAVYVCVLDAVDLFTAWSHAIVVVIVGFKKLVCSKGPHFVPLDLLKEMLQIDATYKFSTLTERASQGEHTHIS